MQAFAALARLVLACIGSLTLSAVAFVLMNVLPIWGMFLVYGEENVMDAPAHGGVILFLTVPVSGMIAAVLFVFSASFLYHKMAE